MLQQSEPSSLKQPLLNWGDLLIKKPDQFMFDLTKLVYEAYGKDVRLETENALINL